MKQFKLHRLIILFIMNLLLFTPSSLTAGEWVQMDSGTTNDLNGVWGTSADNVYAVGYGNTVLHYDGTSWSPESLPVVEGRGNGYKAIFNLKLYVKDDRLDMKPFAPEMEDFEYTMTALWKRLKGK